MTKRKYRSQLWFSNPDNLHMTANYVAWYLNDGTPRERLQSGKPIIGISQSGSDLTPCNKIHRETVEEAKRGIEEAGGVPFVFPLHPIQDNARRPTAHRDRNLAAMALVEILHGYPLDGVVLTTGCDKTTPASVMGAATANLPAIVLSGGPMLNGYFEGKRSGSGMAVWEARRRVGAGEWTEEQFFDSIAASAPSLGHCNTMGTALTMNSMSEALGLSLPGSAAIPAPYSERLQNAYETGKRIVELVEQDVKPTDILTLEAFENAIVALSAIGGSTNAQQHLTAMARHAGIRLPDDIWMRKGYEVPLLVNLQPAGEYLGEDFYKAGGLPAVMGELERAGLLNSDALTVSGKTMGENIGTVKSSDEDIIKPFSNPVKENAGFAVLNSNFFDFAIMKTSVISKEFAESYLEQPGEEGAFEARAVVFDGVEDYHERINDPALNIDGNCILVMRGAGSIGWPGSAEVANVQPPDEMLARGVRFLPTLSDGRQSGTADCPSILHVTPEAALGGGLALLRDGDMLRIDLKSFRCDLLMEEAEIEERRKAAKASRPPYQTPWQEIFSQHVESLKDGACLDFAYQYHSITDTVPRDNH